MNFDSELDMSRQFDFHTPMVLTGSATPMDVPSNAAISVKMQIEANASLVLFEALHSPACESVLSGEVPEASLPSLPLIAGSESAITSLPTSILSSWSLVIAVSIDRSRDRLLRARK